METSGARTWRFGTTLGLLRHSQPFVVPALVQRTGRLVVPVDVQDDPVKSLGSSLILERQHRLPGEASAAERFCLTTGRRRRGKRPLATRTRLRAPGAGGKGKSARGLGAGAGTVEAASA